MSTVFISIGSNINPEGNVLQAVKRLAREVHILGISTFYRTPPIGRPEQSYFYNGVVVAETCVPPRDLKHRILSTIENELGRRRTADKYAARTIDLDILIYDDIACWDDDLVLPDPDIFSRPFVAIPLAELAPDLQVPGTPHLLRDVAKSMPQHDIMPLDDFTRRLRREVLDEQGKG